MTIFIMLILGLCFGSFVNALVWRLYKQSMTGKTSKANRQKYSIVQGRSMCTSCGHILSWYDLLPVVSWLSLGGKCRYCHKSISWQYPLVEIATAALFVLSYVFWPVTLNPQLSVLFALWLTMLVGFMALVVYDLRWMILPNRIVFPLQAIALMYVFAAFISSKGDSQIILGTLLGVLFSAGLFCALFQISKGKWIGGGDVKLAVALGLVLGGPAEALLMIFIASLLGSVVGVPLLVSGKAKSGGKLPFGPFLIGATIVVYLFNDRLFAWYENQFLFT